MIAENRRRITQELEENNEVINIGLGFFGVRAVISETVENQLDFYDKDDNHLSSKRFEDTDGIVGFAAVFGFGLDCQFKDNSFNDITHMADDNRHIFVLNSHSDKSCSYRIE